MSAHNKLKRLGVAGAAEVQAAAGAEGYNNKYRNGWGASVAAVRAAVEEQRRNKRGTGTPVSQMAAPLPLSRFAWPVSAVRCCLDMLL